MPVSSQTLFHFTNSIDAVRGILENNFIPSYCLEKSPINNLNLGIPMVCFCDIPLTQTKNHTSVYGKYAIGLKKKWGIENKLNPVWYINSHSVASETLKKMADSLLRNHLRDVENKSTNTINSAIDVKCLLNLLCYTKSTSGCNWDKHAMRYKDKDLNFYDEKEWRFIPHFGLEINEAGQLPVEILFRDVFLDKTLLKEANDRIRWNKLAFTPDDVEYIIVKEKKDIVPMYDEIHKIKSGLKFSDDEIKTLLTKIIHIERIHEDF